LHRYWETDGASLQVAKLELAGKPLGKYPHSAPHTQTDSQPENIVPPVLYRIVVVVVVVVNA